MRNPRCQFTWLVTTLLACVSLPGCGGSRVSGKPVLTANDLPNAVTVLVDFSASFAPLTANDAFTLRSVLTAVVKSATQDWPGPTQVLFRRIGTSSIMNQPICNTIVHQPSLTGGGNDTEVFRKGLNVCVELVLAASASSIGHDEYTDISGAIEASAQATQNNSAAKVLIVLSDFLEQQAPKAKRASLHLNGERVVLIHRPGLDDKSIEAHMDRLEKWRKALRAAGAKSVAVIPEQWATSGIVEQVLDNASQGTIGLVMLDPNLIGSIQPAELRRRRIEQVAEAVAERAAEWPKPVTMLWYVFPSAPTTLSWMPPFEYAPMLVEKEGEINNAEQLKRVTRETAIGALSFCRLSSTRADLRVLLRLLHPPDVIGKRETRLFLVSSFDAPIGEPARDSWAMKQEIVLMMYSPVASDGADPNGLFSRLAHWKQRLTTLGAARVCAFEFLSFTSNELKSCGTKGGAL